MTSKEIKEKIDFNNKLIRDMFNPNQFTLNNTVRELLEENARLQEKCKHEYDEGYCIYCYKEKK